MRILFITATRLGDAVLSTGLLSHLLTIWPDAQFTVACGPVAAGLFEHMPRLQHLHIMTKRRYDLHWFDLWKACAGHKWDITVDLRGSAVTFLLRSGKRYIMRGGRRPGLRTEHLAQVLRLSPPPSPVIWTSEADRHYVNTFLPAHTPLIALGPTANWSGKIWPAENYLPLWKALSERYPQARPVVLYGPGPQEQALAQPLLDTLPGVIDAGGKFSLSQTAAILMRCRLYIGNDSGLMHLSAAAGTPTLGLFGPSRVSEYAPSGQHTAWVVADGPEGHAPITGLCVSTVTEAALTMMDSLPL